MIGILLISHGNFSVGIKNSAEMFFSNSIDAFDAIAVSYTHLTLPTNSLV